MALEPTGAAAPIHAPFARSEFFRIRLTRDPDTAYAAVVRIIAEHRGRPDFALERCSEWVDGFGVECMTLADDSELLYVNVGDTYKATLCFVPGRGVFVSSWGDAVEVADRARADAWGDRQCANCSEWTDGKGDPCGSCGRDPETGEPWPEPLRHVRLDLGYTLRTWDTGKLSAGRTCVGYELCDARGNAILRGVDFRPSPMHADDSDATLRALCGFLFLRPGDTDAEYFASYSPAQLQFAGSSDCELLAFLYSEEGTGTFADVETSEGGAA